MGFPVLAVYIHAVSCMRREGKRCARRCASQARARHEARRRSQGCLARRAGARSTTRLAVASFRPQRRHQAAHRVNRRLAGRHKRHAGVFPDTASAAAENVGVLSKSRCRTDDISDYCHAFDIVADPRLATIIRQWQILFHLIFNKIRYFNSLGTV